MRNEFIKQYAKARGVRLYEVAEFIGISNSDFSMKYTRKPLSEVENASLQRVIDIIAERRGEDEKV